ncbi:hypothetical protein TNIN_347911 [Trichonephila inaurata madagascariensis]|uniref:Uncharacterized protein n=1 Tax=Trichonephila inaurata madagascariensis TaxID=2747483 RepID=A0A8X6YQY7_9ARAC|nr:hypothetical protein TNIN_347911 [Trichonephila inaurata madagascariensis]
MASDAKTNVIGSYVSEILLGQSQLSLAFLIFLLFRAKETQYFPHHNIHFVPTQGHLEVVIQNTTFTLRRRTVDCSDGCPYSLKIVRDREHCSHIRLSNTLFQHQFAE